MAAPAVGGGLAKKARSCSCGMPWSAWKVACWAVFVWVVSTGVIFASLAALLLGALSVMVGMVIIVGYGVNKIVVWAVHPEKLRWVHLLLWCVVMLLGLVFPKVACVALILTSE